jgi:hypothetical protein
MNRPAGEASQRVVPLLQPPPSELQDRFANQNAMRIVGPHLTPPDERLGLLLPNGETSLSVDAIN